MADTDAEESEEGLLHDKRHKKKLLIGTILEIMILIGAAILFILTEDIRTPLVLIDQWTLPQIAFLFLMWLADKLLIRQKENDTAGEKEEEKGNDNDQDTE